MGIVTLACLLWMPLAATAEFEQGRIQLRETRQQRDRRELADAFDAWRNSRHVEQRICKDSPEKVHRWIEEEREDANLYFQKRRRDRTERTTMLQTCSSISAARKSDWNVAAELRAIKSRIASLLEIRRQLRPPRAAPASSPGLQAAIDEKRQEEATALDQLLLTLMERQRELETADGSGQQQSSAGSRLDADCGLLQTGFAKEDGLIAEDERNWNAHFDFLHDLQDECTANDIPNPRSAPQQRPADPETQPETRERPWNRN